MNKVTYEDRKVRYSPGFLFDMHFKIHYKSILNIFCNVWIEFSYISS